MTAGAHIIALCGGVGGAKLAFGLTRLLAPDQLTIVVNTGDDFEHLGLSISPDVDTVAYTLADLADRERGWGRKDESWNFMAALGAIGGEDWFNLGDRDLAMHIERTRRLAAGESLSRVTADLIAALGVRHTVVPMSDDPVRTVVEATEGDLAFQHYFVRERCQPAVRAVRYDGAAQARPSPGLVAALTRDDVAAVVICPSNPYLSVDPILAVPDVRAGLKALSTPIVAVSPLIGGAAVKGPAAKMMRELGAQPGVEALAAHYQGLLDGMVIDHADAGHEPSLRALGLRALVTDTVMRDDDDRLRLARETVGFAQTLTRASAPC